MHNVVRCPICRHTLIAEERTTHKCHGVVKEIPISFSYTLIKHGTKTIICRGLDGVLYKLVQTSDEDLQRRQSDTDLTEPSK
jgi:hypothetical protein